jgi:hypothetical protein
MRNIICLNVQIVDFRSDTVFPIYTPAIDTSICNCQVPVIDPRGKYLNFVVERPLTNGGVRNMSSRYPHDAKLSMCRNKASKALYHWMETDIRRMLSIMNRGGNDPASSAIGQFDLPVTIWCARCGLMPYSRATSDRFSPVWCRAMMSALRSALERCFLVMGLSGSEKPAYKRVRMRRVALSRVV